MDNSSIAKEISNTMVSGRMTTLRVRASYINTLASKIGSSMRGSSDQVTDKDLESSSSTMEIDTKDSLETTFYGVKGDYLIKVEL